MADYVYPTNLFPEVRAAIGLGITENDLSNDTLNLSIYKGEGERFIMQNLTEAQYTDSSQEDAVNAAATFYIASLVVPTLRIVNSERVPGGDMTFASVNLQALADRLRSQAEERVGAVVEATGTPAPTRPFLSVFTTAKRRIC